MLKSKTGNAFIISIFFVAIIICIFAFIMAIFVGETNSLLHNIKLDMYSINKSAIISVNKGITSREDFDYDKKELKKYFEDLLKKKYKLNDDFKNAEGLVREVEVIQYDILKKGKKDDYSKEKLKNNVIHAVIKVRVRPIFLEDTLKDVFTFYIHEDVSLNELIM